MNHRRVGTALVSAAVAQRTCDIDYNRSLVWSQFQSSAAALGIASRGVFPPRALLFCDLQNLGFAAVFRTVAYWGRQLPNCPPFSGNPAAALGHRAPNEISNLRSPSAAFRCAISILPLPAAQLQRR